MTCKTHTIHEHNHDTSCGHTALKHDDHIDYLHENHLHHIHNDHVDEHVLAENSNNPSSCTPNHNCNNHDQTHQHGPRCGHEAVPHGNHIDYIVSEHLHSPCGDHCDHHGPVVLA